MTEVPPGTGIDGLPDRGSVVAADQVCDAFEAAWRAGGRPRLEDSLRPAGGPGRAALLAELLPLDVEYRRRLGESPTPDEYAARFPELVSSFVGRVV